MVPFIDLPTPRIGDISFPWFMILIVVGIAAGTEFSRWRAIQQKLSVKITVDCTLFMVGLGFLVAHVVAVVFYHPELLEENWRNILPWHNFAISSIGGFLGAGIAIPLFLVGWKKVPAFAYTDILAQGFALGYMFGRLGCATAHDHIGKSTTFFLGVNFPDGWPRSDSALGVRHDLGLYEAILMACIFGLFWILDKRNSQRFHGLYSGLLLVIYAPFRLLFDSLRATDLDKASDGIKSDMRWIFGLTAAQVGAIALFAIGVWILATRYKKGRYDTTAEERRDFGGTPSADGEGAADESADDPAGESDAPEPPAPESA